MELTEIKAPRPLTQELLRPRQIAEYEDDVKGCEAQLTNPSIQDKGAVRKRLMGLKKDLDTQRPIPITDGATKDALVRKEEELREQITHGMLSSEEMRKCGPTAVDRHIKWERAMKPLIKMWKNIRLQLHAGEDDSSVANLEQYRPEGREQGIRTDSLIPGIHTMSALAKANWPLGEPTADTAVKQVVRRQGRHSMGATERHKLSDRMKAKWAAKKAAEQNSPAERVKPGAATDS